MPDHPDLREQLAAFLAGELDDPAADALQARIDAEPWVGALADDMAAMLVDLGGVDDIDPPPGFGARLREGVEAGIGRPLPDAPPDHRRLAASGAAAATGWADTERPRSREDSRRPASTPGRAAARRATRWRAGLSVAAAVAVLAVGSVTVLTQFGSSSDDTASDMAFDNADQADDSAALQMEGRSDSTFEALTTPAPGDADEDAAASGPADETADSADDADADGESLAAPAAEDETAAVTFGADGPAVLTLGPDAGTDDAIRDTVGSHPSATALLGTDATDIRELAAAYRDELLRGPVWADATPAGACLTDTLDAAGDDLVPAVAARIDPPDGPVVAYALVGTSTGGELDTIDVWVLDLDSCAVERVVRQG